MNTLRNFVVIFFLGIVVFLAGVMVGKSMKDNAPKPVAGSAGTIVALPKPTAAVPVDTRKDAGEEQTRPAADNTMPLPLPLGKDSATKEGDRESAKPESEKSKEELKFTFYESLTNKKAKTPPLAPVEVNEKSVKSPKVEKPAIKVEPAVKSKAPRVKGLVLQVAAYPQEGKARLLRNSLMREGYGKVVVVAAKIPGKGVWYRVRIIDIKDKVTARLLQQRLQKQKSIRSFIAR